MTRLLQVFALIAASLAGQLAPVAAQSLQRLSAEVSGAGNFAAGNRLFDPQSRPALEAQGRYTFSRFSIGAGAVFQSPQNNLHEVRATVFVEPRLILAAGPGRAFYGAGLLGLGRFICTTLCTNEAMHVNLGGGAGLLLRLNSRVAADLGVEYLRVLRQAASGFVLLRAGLSFGL